VPEFRRKRGRPPLNKPVNGNAPKYHLKAPQQVDAPKAVTTPTEQQSPETEAKESFLTVAIPMTDELKRGFDEYGKSIMLPAIESPKEPPQNPLADLTPVDSIEFTNGKNTLKIVLSKRHNRMYRVQVYLNSTMEIRPATYTGYAPASTFWGFLKEITK
jgi:hypothetical protein